MKTDNRPSENSLLLHSGKSSRLQAMRLKALQSDESTKTGGNLINKPGAVASGGNKSLLQIQNIIDQRLHDILSIFPEGKKQRLFKIRFGVELEQIRDLPINRIISILNIQQPEIKNILASDKSIGVLNYNGADTSDQAVQAARFRS